jgi:uncharacterized protein with HEPN domain
MKHPERIEDYLEHISGAIERATEYLRVFATLDAFKQQRRDQDAIIRNLEIIGEAARKIQKLAPEFLKAHPELPWSQMRGIRDKVIHEYFDVDLTVIWGTVKDELPNLKQQIDALLFNLKHHPDREP